LHDDKIVYSDVHARTSSALYLILNG